jgi:methylmalonyl-CoA/ethylmalonyl-CoA epimerase
MHHVGYIVRELEPANRYFAALGYEPTDAAAADDYHDAEILFLRRPGQPAGEPLIELIRPRSETSKVYRHTVDSKLQIHHVCYAVDDIAAASAVAKERRFREVQPVIPAQAIAGSRIAFFFAQQIGLIELVERPPF